MDVDGFGWIYRIVSIGVGLPIAVLLIRKAPDDLYEGRYDAVALRLLVGAPLLFWGFLNLLLLADLG